MPDTHALPAVSVIPVVSVVVVHYRGAADTITCLNALLTDLDYPAERLELICVDNASGDGSLQIVQESLGKAQRSRIRFVKAHENGGFAAGCNLGALHAQGSVLAFLNNDARPDPQWVRAAVATLRAEPTVGAVASKVVDSTGEHIDFVGAGLTWFGMGYKPQAGQPIAESQASNDNPRDVLFGTGSALFVRAELYRTVGGFDERYFLFYEDVDLGWRLNARGWRVRYEPRSLAFHRHHGSMSEVSEAREFYLLERNALFFLYKNFGPETLNRTLPAAMALAIRRATARGELDPAQLELSQKPTNPTWDAQPVPVPRETMAGVLAIDQFVQHLPALQQAREQEQQERVLSDRDLIPLMRQALEPAYPLPRYLEAHDILVQAFGLDDTFGQRRKIAVLSGDALTERMAGPAIRAWHMAEELAREHEVRVISTNPATLSSSSGAFEVLRSGPAELDTHAAWADIVITGGHLLEQTTQLRRESDRTILVCDLYDPMHLELLEQGRDIPESTDQRRSADLRGVTSVLNTQLERGDFFLCASERQRHFWLGHLAGLSRLTPELYDHDPTTRSLLEVVPFGLPAIRPLRTGPGAKESTVDSNAKLIIWAGGVYSWFDPLTLIHAVQQLSEKHQDVRLLFLGMKHPNPEVPDMSMATRTKQLADHLGLTDKFVFFNQDWVPYEQRQNYLLDADCGVTTHYEHVETTFAFRTRVLDYLWADLPIVTTDGDAFADLVRSKQLGVVVPPEDPQALAEALERALFDEEFAAACRERIAVVRQRFTWDEVLKPLLAFCRNPRPAADRLVGSAPLSVNPKLSTVKRLKRDAGLFRAYLRSGGLREVAKRAGGRLFRLVKRGFVPVSGKTDTKPQRK